MIIEKYLITDLTTTVDVSDDTDLDLSYSVEVFDGNLYISGAWYDEQNTALNWVFSADDITGVLENETLFRADIKVPPAAYAWDSTIIAPLAPAANAFIFGNII